MSIVMDSVYSYRAINNDVMNYLQSEIEFSDLGNGLTLAESQSHYCTWEGIEDFFHVLMVELL